MHCCSLGSYDSGNSATNPKKCENGLQSLQEAINRLKAHRFSEIQERTLHKIPKVQQAPVQSNSHQDRRTEEQHHTRYMAMSPSYPCSKPCSTRAHNETLKKLTLVSTFINLITIGSWPSISNYGLESGISSDCY